MTNAEYDIGISQNFLTIQGVSQYLGIKPKTLYARVKEIPHYKVGRLVRFRKEDVDAWMEKHRVARDEKTQEPEPESSTPAMEPVPKPLRARKSRKRRGPITDIDRMISKAIDQVKGEGYTASHGKSDQVKGSGKEV
jgi:excisionase family DNA binding protein